MGPDPTTELQPSGEVEAWGAFHWPSVPEGGIWYLLRVEDADGNVLVDERCETSEWIPTDEPSPLEGIDRVNWSVEARDAGTGAARDERWSASAWLSSWGTHR